MKIRYFFWILAVLLLVNPVFAEEVNQILDDIVVTASRVGENMSDTPVTINVLDKKEIETVKFRNPDEILRRIPGIYTHDFGGESELTSIRVPTHFSNPYTLLLVDGVPVSSYGTGSSGNFGEINSDNIARIEVVKGPASALYGSNAIGGVINVITKNPTSQPFVKLWTETGAHHQWRSGFTGSGALDTLGYQLGFNHIFSDHWREQSELEKKAANIKLEYIPLEQGLLTFKLDYINSENESPGTLNKDDFSANWQQSYHTFSYKKLEKVTPVLSYTHYLDNAEVKTTLTLRDSNEKSIPNYAIRKQRNGYVGKFSKSERRDVSGQFLYSRDFERFSSKMIFGIDAERGSLDSQQYNLDVTFDKNINKYTDYNFAGIDDDFDITTKLYALYLQFSLSLLDRLSLTAGGRYDNVTYDVDSKVDPLKTGDTNFSRFSPKFGAVYQFSPTLNSYLNISQGFVIPTTSQLLTSSWANSNLKPETATNYEVGIRSSFFDHTIDFNVALYMMDIKDKIISTEKSAYQREYLNAGKTLQKGVEVTAAYAPVDYAGLCLAYTYAHNTFEEFTPGSVDFAGNYLPRSPRHRLNLRMNVHPIKRLDIELEIDKISSQYTDDANTQEYSRPTLLHLRAKYNWRNWSFWMALENITNEEYATYVSYSSSDAASTFYSGKPRTIYAGLSYTWQGGNK